MTTPLRRLDEAWLPRAAAWAQRGARAARRPRLRLLRRVLREQPTLAAAVAIVLVAGALVAAAGRDVGAAPDGPPAPAAPPALVATIGPQPGTSVPDYLARATFDLRRFAVEANGRQTFAVVDAARALTPAQARALLAGARVVRAYVRVPSSLPTEVRAVPVTSTAAFDRGLRALRDVAAASVHSYAALLAALQHRTRAQREVRRGYARRQAAAAVEARALARPERCQCLFAFVVRGDVAALTALSRRPGVRAVDPAPPAVPLTGLTVLPLRPDVTTVVPRASLAGG